MYIINLPGRPQLHHMCHFVHPITFKPLTKLRQLIIFPVPLTISTITEVCTLTLTQDKARICLEANKQELKRNGTPLYQRIILTFKRGLWDTGTPIKRVFV